MKKMISCIFALLLTTSNVNAADIIAGVIGNAKDKNAYGIIIKHEIQKGDSDKFIAVYDAIKNKNILLVSIDSIGGNELESAKIARFIKEKKLTTLTKHNGVCYKDCLLIASAGSLRIIRDSTIVSVKRMPLVEKEYPNLYKELNIPKDVISKINNLKPNQEMFLTPFLKGKFEDHKRVFRFFDTKLNYVTLPPVKSTGTVNYESRY